MEREKVLDKLVKMIAQRDSEEKLGNAAAADAFAGAINRMMLEHEITAVDVDRAASAEDDPVVEVVLDFEARGVDRVRRRVAWQEGLARVVARGHLCRFLVCPGSNRVWFVGVQSHAVVAEYVYGLLVRSAAKMAEEEYVAFFRALQRDPGRDVGEARGFKAAWLDAFVSRIAERLREARAAAVAASASAGVSSSTAIVRLDQSLARVDAYMKETRGERRGRGVDALNAAGRANAEGRAAGRAAADRVALQKGVGGAKSPKALPS